MFVRELGGGGEIYNELIIHIVNSVPRVFCKGTFIKIAKHYICDSAALHWRGSVLLFCLACHYSTFTGLWLPFPSECAESPSCSGHLCGGQHYGTPSPREGGSVHFRYW